MRGNLTIIPQCGPVYVRSMLQVFTSVDEIMFPIAYLSFMAQTSTTFQETLLRIVYVSNYGFLLGAVLLVAIAVALLGFLLSGWWEDDEERGLQPLDVALAILSHCSVVNHALIQELRLPSLDSREGQDPGW